MRASILYSRLFVIVDWSRPEVNQPKTSTKERILNSACFLFSEHAFENVSTRQIADHANVQHGSLYYHFENKETLYHHVFRKVYDLDNALTYDVLMKKEPLIFDTPEGKAYAIQRVVFDYFQRHVFISDAWRKKFIARELSTASPRFTRHVGESLDEVYNKMMDFYYFLRPGGPKVEAYYWAHITDANGLYTFATENYVDRNFDEQFKEELSYVIVTQTAKIMILLLDLPVPQMLM